jgi:hypothetical protein
MWLVCRPAPVESSSQNPLWRLFWAQLDDSVCLHGPRFLLFQQANGKTSSGRGTRQSALQMCLQTAAQPQNCSSVASTGATAIGTGP